MSEKSQLDAIDVLRVPDELLYGPLRAAIDGETTYQQLFPQTVTSFVSDGGGVNIMEFHIGSASSFLDPARSSFMARVSMADNAFGGAYLNRGSFGLIRNVRVEGPSGARIYELDSHNYIASKLVHLAATCDWETNIAPMLYGYSSIKAAHGLGETGFGHNPGTFPAGAAPGSIVPTFVAVGRSADGSAAPTADDITWAQVPKVLCGMEAVHVDASWGTDSPLLFGAAWGVTPPAAEVTVIGASVASLHAVAYATPAYAGAIIGSNISFFGSGQWLPSLGGNISINSINVMIQIIDPIMNSRALVPLPLLRGAPLKYYLTLGTARGDALVCSHATPQFRLDNVYYNACFVRVRDPAYMSAIFAKGASGGLRVPTMVYEQQTTTLPLSSGDQTYMFSFYLASARAMYFTVRDITRGNKANSNNFNTSSWGLANYVLNIVGLGFFPSPNRVQVHSTSDGYAAAGTRSFSQDALTQLQRVQGLLHDMTTETALTLVNWEFPRWVGVIPLMTYGTNTSLQRSGQDLRGRQCALTLNWLPASNGQSPPFYCTANGTDQFLAASFAQSLFGGCDPFRAWGCLFYPSAVLDGANQGTVSRYLDVWCSADADIIYADGSFQIGK